MTWHTSNNSTPSTCSPEQVAAFSLISYLDTIQSERVRSRNTLETCCSPDSETESFQASQYGTTFARSTARLGGGASMSCAEDFPARTLVPQGKARALMASEAAYGERWHGSFAKYDHDTHLWKTPQCSLLGDFIEFSETWPKWGMMQNGVCSERVMPELGTSGIESGYLLPTPRAQEPGRTSEGYGDCLNDVAHGRKGWDKKNFPTPYGLSANQGQGDGEFGKAIRNWPTPVCSDGTTGAIIGKNDQFKMLPSGNLRKINQNGTDGSLGLARTVIAQTWPTPLARDYKDGMIVPPSRIKDPGMATLGQKVAMEHGGQSTPQTYPTPRCFMHKDALTDRGKSNLGEVINEKEQVTKTGQLNPSWVEWLMGWPIGWTDLRPLETDKFRSVQLWHG